MKKATVLCILATLVASLSVFAQPQEQVKVTLYQTHGAPLYPNTVGQALVIYGDQTTPGMFFHNAIDNGDVTYPGTYVPFAVSRYYNSSYPNSALMYERRAYTGTEIGSNNDTLQLMSHTLGNTDTAYTITIAVGRMNYGVVGKLEDLYLGTSIPININPTDTAYTTYQFSVIGRNGPEYYYLANPWVHRALTGSKIWNRFRIVFSNNPTYSRPLFQFSGIQVTNGIIYWAVRNEESVRSYQVQKLQGEQWSTFGLVQKGQTYKFPLHSSSGKYRVKAVLLNSSADSSKVVALESAQQPIRFTLYPNPVSGKTATTISFTENYGRAEIQVIRPTGGILYSTGIIATGSIRLPIITEPGVYTVRIIQQNRISVQQLIVNK